MKKYIGKLKELNGEFEYEHNHLFESAGDPHEYINNYAAGFYGDDGAPFEEDAYEFFGGGVLVYIYSVEEVTDAEYSVLQKYSV